MTRVLCIGCFHGNLSDQLIRQIKKAKPDAILTLGDYTGSDDFHKLLFYSMNLGIPWDRLTGKRSAEKIIKNEYLLGIKVIEKLAKLKIPIFFILGNHDFDQKQGKKISYADAFKIYGARYMHRKTFAHNG